jgi:Leucine-rich repeat (LRR) protein
MHGKINEIHQSDLKPFPELEYLNLHNNTIEVLEEGLFDFNPNLGFISFANNKIYKIHPEIFDKLTKLTFLFLDANKCVDKLAKDDFKAFNKAIKEVKTKCLNDTITTTTTTTTEMSKINAEELSENCGWKFGFGGWIMLGSLVVILNF